MRLQQRYREIIFKHISAMTAELGENDFSPGWWPSECDEILSEQVERTLEFSWTMNYEKELLGVE